MVEEVDCEVVWAMARAVLARSRLLVDRLEKQRDGYAVPVQDDLMNCVLGVVVSGLDDDGIALIRMNETMKKSVYYSN
ncbi:hypothetical protein AKJ16_DCAP25460 [Drosera capensis]